MVFGRKNRSLPVVFGRSGPVVFGRAKLTRITGFRGTPRAALSDPRSRERLAPWGKGTRPTVAPYRGILEPDMRAERGLLVVLEAEWWRLCIVGGIVAVVVYRMARRIEKLEQRAFEIEMDLLDVAYGDIPDRLREQMELIKAGHERRRAVVRDK